MVLSEPLPGQHPYRPPRESLGALGALEEAILEAEVAPPSSRVAGDRRRADIELKQSRAALAAARP